MQVSIDTNGRLRSDVGGGEYAYKVNNTASFQLLSNEVLFLLTVSSRLDIAVEEIALRRARNEFGEEAAASRV
jgi:hypothetical protein